MVEFLKGLVSVVNDFHDIVVSMVDTQNHPFADKWLHFIVIAIVGIVIFVCVHALFKFLSKYGLAAISFVCTFAILVVVTVAIEIQQGITGRGNVELADIIFGLFGFLCACGVIVVVNAIRRRIKAHIGNDTVTDQTDENIVISDAI